MTRLLFTFLASAMVAFAACANKPVFVGHRGSLLGVSNTEEAFRNGAGHYHYQGLECDIHVTADGEYVILHDATTASLCDKDVDVASATLDELKALTLTQTRDGITYSGTICTLEEFLDICIDKNVFPIIELKWASGINNDDMSNFQGLWDIVVEKGLQNEAIFLSSMANSLAFIKANYPQATCQYLITADSDEKFEFCKRHGISPSFSRNALTADVADRYSSAGFDIAVWTVNTEEDYIKFGNMEVSMMTCDCLMPDDMPELDELDESDDAEPGFVLPQEALSVESMPLNGAQLSPDASAVPIRQKQNAAGTLR